MMAAVVVFVSQYLYVLLLGLQSLNVNHNRKASAMATSFVLGSFGFFLTATIADNRGDTFGVVWWAYVLAGPFGIVTSMFIFHRRQK